MVNPPSFANIVKALEKIHAPYGLVMDGRIMVMDGEVVRMDDQIGTFGRVVRNLEK